MVKILHAADFHLDSAFGALTNTQARERRGEMRELLGRIAQKANEEHADIVILAGDLFDGAALYRETAEALAEALSEIRGRVFISPGNHDPYGPGSGYDTVEWPENVTIFKYGMIESVELTELNCVVYGAAFKAGMPPERLMDDIPMKLEDFVREIQAFGNRFLFLGDGMPVHRARLTELLGDAAVFAPPQNAYLRPAAVAALAMNTDAQLSYTELMPLYLRAPSAERNKKLMEAAKHDK